MPRPQARRHARGGRIRRSRAVTAAARLTYVGHATVLIDMDGVRLLTDPVLRRRIGPP